MHDLLLSAPDVRQGVYAEIERWMNAYTAAGTVPSGREDRATSD